MGAKYPVQQDLQHFDIDDHESGIDDQVQDRYQRISEHLALPQGQQQDLLPSFCAP